MRFSNLPVSEFPFGTRSPRTTTQTIPLTAIDLCLLNLGLLLNVAGYGNLLVLPIGVLFFSVGYLVLSLSPWGNYWERRMYVRMFVVGWLAMGISASYDYVLSGIDIVANDAESFFRVSSQGIYSAYSLADLLTTHEGGVAIKIWQAVYDGFALFGIPKERFIGILVNVVLVSFACVFGVRAAKLIYGNDHFRLRLLFHMATLCGIFWLFAGFHLRDAFVLLAVTGLATVYIWFLRRPSFGIAFFITITLSVVTAGIFQSLRNEFLFLPLVFAITAALAIIFSHKSKIKLVWRWLFLLLVIPVVVGVAVSVYPELSFLLEQGAGYYLIERGGLNASTNPGWVLVYQSPWYVQFFLKPLVMFIFPLPVWWGLQLDSAYAFLKGLATPFFYIVLPLAGVSVHHLYRFLPLRSPQQLFLLFTSLGMTIVTAFTSGETRHLGAFLIIIFLLCLLPDLKEQKTQRKYLRLLMGGLFIMTLAHGFWLLRRF